MFERSRVRVDVLLRREANNLDLVRLICAILVIYGHSIIVFAPPDVPIELLDPTTLLAYPGLHCGALAVKVFFFLSGLLVTNSLLTKRSLGEFIRTRALRVWPALGVVTIVTALLIGPIVSTLDASEYFRDPSVFRYVLGTLLMQHPDRLPHVFLENHCPFIVNGSLWSLRYEIGAYLALLGAALSGLLFVRPLALAVIAWTIVDPLLPVNGISAWLGGNPQIVYLPACFALGALLALYPSKITIGLGTVLLLGAGFLVGRATPFGPLLFFSFVFASVLVVSGAAWFKKLRLSADLSYGTFLWGFPIQQLIAQRWPHVGLFPGFFLSTGIALAIAALSWRYVELLCLRWARRVRKQSPAAGFAASEPVLFR